MPKINQEEYELLKNLSDYWKWIARDKNGRLYKFQEKPKKVNSFQWNDRNQTWLGMSGDRFQFIQWEDEEPYNIAELIEEYEFENVLSDKEQFEEWYHGTESEETEVKKGKEWLKKEVNELPLRFLGFSMLKQREEFTVSKDDVLELIDRLDEPETLSEYWIEQKSIDTHVDTLNGDIQVTFRLDDLQNLLVPEQELPVIPKFVAEYLDFAKSDVPLMRVMELANTRNEWPKWEKEYDWISANDETFARAWLDGYTVEEEQKYYAKIKGHENISSDDKYWNYCITDESLDIGDNNVHADVLAKYVLNASKDEWENLGINDDNADFVKVEELEK